MNYLLDTSVWLRATLFNGTLPREIQRIIDDDGETFGLSIYSLWEAAKKNQKDKLPLPVDLAHWFEAAVSENIQIFPLTPEIIVESIRLPDFPVSDPGDELIVATARVHQLTLLTTDTKLKNYRHARIHYFKPLELK